MRASVGIGDLQRMSGRVNEIGEQHCRCHTAEHARGDAKSRSHGEHDSHADEGEGQLKTSLLENQRKRESH